MIAQNATEIKVITVIEPLNGPVYVEEWGEFAVYLDGELLTWASNELAAERLYIQALTTRRVHQMRNPANDIPFDGRPGDPGGDPDRDDYGLEAVA